MDSSEGRPTEESKPDRYTQEEVDRMVAELMIKDCKIDACLDKFYISARNGSERPPVHRGDVFESKSPEELLPLKEALMVDIETLLPGYFEENNLALSPLEDKFNHFREKIHMRQHNIWSARPRGAKQPDPGNNEFLQSGLSILKEKRVRELSKAASKPSPEAGAPSLSQSSSETALKELRAMIGGEQSNSTFTCGGSIEIVEKNEDSSPKEANAPDILVFSQDDGVRKLHMPCSSHQDATETFVSTIEALVADCSPATFGRGDEDVLDTEYRHAGKLDPTNFCTSFHPADFGILNAIEQAILPSVASPGDNDPQLRRVKAELYKLNVYSGPSGLFRAHVDTPRSESQFGSLVVCLPSGYQGGNLAVRHNGRAVDFNWSARSKTHIQWAAFYSDCEHEIAKVREGHRVTLTYNLYITEPPSGAGMLSSTVVDSTSAPLHVELKSLLEQPGFFPDGGVMGFFCAHFYAHTSSQAGSLLPQRLKGSDMGIFTALKSLGLSTNILPVLERNGEYFSGSETGLDVDKKIQRNGRTFYLENSYFGISDLEYFRKKGYLRERSYRTGGKKKKLPSKLHYLYETNDLADSENIHQRWKNILMNQYPMEKLDELRGALVGKDLFPYKLTDLGGEDFGSDEVAKQMWPHHPLPGIAWVTPPKQEQMALTHICYGNEASLGSRYSCAAVIAIVPPTSERLHPGT